MCLTKKQKDDRRLERDVLKLLQSIGIKRYGRSKQIPMNEIHPGAKKGRHLELDIIGIEGKIGFII